MIETNYIYIMRKHLIVFIMFLFSTLCWGKSKEIVWKNLVHGSQSCQTLVFHSVQFTDSATIVDFDVTERDCKLQPKTKLITDNGTELKFQKAVGGPVQKRLKEPGRYQMYFEPAPKGCKWIHFYEGNGSNDWRVYYIRDKKTKVKVDKPVDYKDWYWCKWLSWKRVKYNLQETLPEARYNVDTATVTFRLLGYKPWMKFSIPYYYYTFGEPDRKEVKVTFDSTGSAILKLPLNLVTTLNCREKGMNLVLYPGDHVSCLIDLTNDESEIDFKGSLATLHHEMTGKEYQNLSSQFSKFAPFAKVADCETEEERVRALNDGLETCKKQIDQSKLSDATKAMLRLEAEKSYWLVLRSYPSFLYTVRGLVIDDRDEFSKFWKQHRSTFNDSIRKVLATEQPFEIATAPYAPALGRDFFYNISTFERAKATVHSYLQDLYNADIFINQGMSTESVSNIQINDPVLKDAVNQNYARLKAKEESLKQDDAIYYQKLDSIAPDSILQYIIDKYKGQTFMIDMWATWCGPCRSGHQMMAPLKEELKNEPIKFVYITDTTSPAGKWKEMIDEIPGDHFYLTRAQQQAIMRVFESTGIPTYAIYDAEGKQTYKHTGFPGNEEMKKQLFKAMGK